MRAQVLLPVVLWLCAGSAHGAEGDAAPGAAEEAAQDEGLSKKAAWLKDKQGRKPRRARTAPALLAPPCAVLSVHNQWTAETLPLRAGADLAEDTWNRFLRCHHTNQATTMDGRLLGLLRRAAAHFNSNVIEIVSGFRAPKYNLMLRKKGHQVARDSQHTHGTAVDFRVAGVPLPKLRRFVLAQRMGGVGFYPRSQFVHADTGPLRTWTAE